MQNALLAVPILTSYDGTQIYIVILPVKNIEGTIGHMHMRLTKYIGDVTLNKIHDKMYDLMMASYWGGY